MITVLTDPLPIGSLFISELSRHIYRKGRDLVKPPKYNYGFYRGHYAVTRSLIEGLKKNGLPYNYNPKYQNDLADTVVVLAGVRTLRQAIDLKRQGHIRKLFAGPNIVVFSSDYNSLLACKEIDAVITPSQQVVDLYIEDNPSLVGRCFSWPAGVDMTYWAPQPQVKRHTILIYEKQNKGAVGPVEPYADYVRKRGYQVEIVKYGNFKHSDYLHVLQRAKLMLGFVVDESQGIAWAEAWAADVPTLIWRNERAIFRERTYRGSTAPYLCPENGLYFNDIEDFKQQFARWEDNPQQFSPREWTLANMSDEVCARKLYEMVTLC